MTAFLANRSPLTLVLDLIFVILLIAHGLKFIELHAFLFVVIGVYFFAAPAARGLSKTASQAAN